MMEKAYNWLSGLYCGDDFPEEVGVVVKTRVGICDRGLSAVALRENGAWHGSNREEQQECQYDCSRVIHS